MITRGLASAVLVCVAILLFSTATPAKTPITMEETWNIDLGYFVSKINKIFFQGKFAEEHPAAVKVKFFLDKLGLLSFKDYKGEFRITDTEFYMKETMTLDPANPNSLLAKIAKLPDKPLKIGDIINPESALITFSITNPAEKAEAAWGTITDEQTLNECAQVIGSTTEFQQIRLGVGMADMMLKGLGGFEALKSLVGDELDIMLVEFPEGDFMDPAYRWDDMVFLLAIELDDADGFMKLLGGQDKMFQGEPVFTAGGIPFHNAEKGAVMGVGKGFLIAGTGGKRFKEILDTNKAWKNPPTASAYIRIDLNDIYHSYLDPISQSQMIPYSQYAIAMHKEFWDVTPETNFGALEMICKTAPNTIISETKARPEIVNLFGLVYTLAIAISVSAEQAYTANVPAADDTLYMEQSARTSLYEIQYALTSYHDANDRYPRLVDSLIEDGYLADYPPNPFNEYNPMVLKQLNVYSAGDFAYVAEVSDDIVVGYHLFLFGADRYGGLDIISVNNAFPGWHWEPASDEKPDGIILVLNENGEEIVY
jgi:hypothetical protein